MRQLNRKDWTPPAKDSGGEGFTFTHPETGHVSKSIGYADWSNKIKEHRRANGLSIEPNMMEIAEDQLCDSIPPEWCSHADAGSWVRKGFTFGDLKDGMKAFGALMLGGFNFVPHEEADRRAYICAGCPYNVEAEGCGTCHKIASLITGDVAGKKTQYDDQLKACGVCRCVVSSMVHFPMSAIETTDSPEKQSAFPEWCWRKKGGKAYINVATS